MNKQLKANTPKGFAAVALAVALGTGSAFSAGTILDLTSANVVTSNVFGNQAQFAGTQAFDDDSATRFASGNTFPTWIYVDLGGTTMINQVAIDWEVAHAENYTIRIFDGDTAPNPNSALGDWTTIATITGRDTIDGTGSGADETFNFDTDTFTAVNGSATTSSVTGGSGRFLLLHATTHGGNGLISTYEIDVTGMAIPEPSSTALLGLGGLALILRRRK